MKKIFIDPGHGGHDPGATGNNMRESEIVLDVSKRLGNILEKTGLEIRCSREHDIFVDINSRWRSANSWGADLFISIHVNGFRLKTANGYETFISATKPDDRIFAQNVHDVFIAATGLRDRGVKIDNQSQHTGGLGVLRWSNMPAILVELAFVTAEPTSLDVITLRNRRQEMAEALAEGVLNFLGVESRCHGDSGNIVEDINSNSDETLSKQQCNSVVQETITQEKFNEMMEVYLTARASINDPSPWAEEGFQKAIEVGFTDGSSPLGFATRQEVALMVLRGSFG